jgi:hypothetical protein
VSQQPLSQSERLLLSGAELIKAYEAPVRETPPGYRTCFCGRCGSPVPDPDTDSSWFEIPAGTLDDDPVLRPERHIFVEVRAPWFDIADRLPRLDRAALKKHRQSHP